jgi:hypothetical protein
MLEILIGETKKRRAIESKRLTPKGIRIFENNKFTDYGKFSLILKKLEQIRDEMSKKALSEMIE